MSDNGIHYCIEEYSWQCPKCGEKHWECDLPEYPECSCGFIGVWATRTPPSFEPNGYDDNGNPIQYGYAPPSGERVTSEDAVNALGKLRMFAQKLQSLSPEITKIVDDNFWELLESAKPPSGGESIDQAATYLRDLEACGDIQLVNPRLTWKKILDFAFKEQP